MPVFDPAILVLEDGTRFTGRAYGARGTTFGEAVFATGMTGYQETLTDPSYAGQIVIQTAPHIGNTGVNDVDNESSRIWVAGYVVREPSRVVSNWRATSSLDDELVRQHIVGISHVDTRALTRHLRDKGAQRAGIFSGADADLDASEQLAQVQRSPRMAGLNLSGQVTTPEEYVVPAVGESLGNLVVVDLGVKRATVRKLSEQGFDVHVLPYSATFEQIVALEPAGVFFSNGPGDPAASREVISTLSQVLAQRIPFFGICFGNQLLGRALGLDTYKLPFGHRGINQPVLDKATGRVEITAQNHGFAVKADTEGVIDSPSGFGRVEVSHVGLNDQVVEGLNCLDIPAFSVQYHPEATAGPHDSDYLFTRFKDLIVATREGAATTEGAAN